MSPIPRLMLTPKRTLEDPYYQEAQLSFIDKLLAGCAVEGRLEGGLWSEQSLEHLLPFSMFSLGRAVPTCCVVLNGVED